jgi:hypothetical protein
MYFLFEVKLIMKIRNNIFVKFIVNQNHILIALYINFIFTINIKLIQYKM